MRRMRRYARVCDEINEVYFPTFIYFSQAIMPAYYLPKLVQHLNGLGSNGKPKAITSREFCASAFTYLGPLCTGILYWHVVDACLCFIKVILLSLSINGQLM